MEWLYITLGVLGALLVLTFALWLYLIGAKNGKVLGNLRYAKYAHRGLHGGENIGYDEYAAENSLTAFRRASESGYGIELDVRLTRDGVLVVFHDDNLKRVCGVDKRVIDLDYEELSKIHLKETADVVPTFQEVLDTVAGRVPLLVELKGEDTNVDVARATVDILSGYSGEYIIESFNPLLLFEVKRLNPKIPRGFLATKHTNNEKRRSLKYRIIQRFMLNFLARPHFIAMDKHTYKIFPYKFVCALFRPARMTWTIRSKEEEAAAYEHGFEGVIFENYLSEKN